MDATKKLVLDEGFFKREYGAVCYAYNGVASLETGKRDDWAGVCEYFGLGEYYNSLPKEKKSVRRWTDWRDDRDYCRGIIEDETWTYPRYEFVKALFLGAELTLRWKRPSEKADFWVKIRVDGNVLDYVVTDVLLSDSGSELLDKVTGE